MTSKTDNAIFTVSTLHELRAMQRVFREAKFCLEPGDDEISASPIVLDLFGRLMESLIAAEVALEGEVARERWLEWLTMSGENREEWKAAVGRARNARDWHRWDDSERKEYAKTLLSPFVCSADMLQRFVEAV